MPDWVLPEGIPMEPSKGHVRVLRITFELRVPAGLNSNIQRSRIKKVAERFVGMIHGAAPVVFPWAKDIRTRVEWFYALRDHTEVIQLPPTKHNQVS